VGGGEEDWPPEASDGVEELLLDEEEFAGGVNAGGGEHGLLDRAFQNSTTNNLPPPTQGQNGKEKGRTEDCGQCRVTPIWLSVVVRVILLDQIG